MARKRLTAAEKAALEAEKMAKKAPDVSNETEQVTEKVPAKDKKVKVEEVNGEVVAEFTQQLSIFNQFIYNAKEADSTLIVENLGYGDIYVSDKPDIRIGDEEHRLLFKEQKAFKAKKLFLTSASQPVASIIEIK
ncbi:hypothetical protein [Paenibacillus sp. NPDC057967]|uniref:hypothetical protein n=1 Tax=Paenibacillus sp. NPDC057967 TaxID=3346293 RepID=UPI0036DD851F